MPDFTNAFEPNIQKVNHEVCSCQKKDTWPQFNCIKFEEITGWNELGRLKNKNHET